MVVAEFQFQPLPFRIVLAVLSLIRRLADTQLKLGVFYRKLVSYVSCGFQSALEGKLSTIASHFAPAAKTADPRWKNSLSFVFRAHGSQQAPLAQAFAPFLGRPAI